MVKFSNINLRTQPARCYSVLVRVSKDEDIFTCKETCLDRPDFLTIPGTFYYCHASKFWSGTSRTINEKLTKIAL